MQGNQENHHNIDKHFRESLRNARVSPPDELWDKIAGDLENTPQSYRLFNGKSALSVLLVLLWLTANLLALLVTGPDNSNPISGNSFDQTVQNTPTTAAPSTGEPTPLHSGISPVDFQKIRELLATGEDNNHAAPTADNLTASTSFSTDNLDGATLQYTDNALTGNTTWHTTPTTTLEEVTTHHSGQIDNQTLTYHPKFDESLSDKGMRDRMIPVRGFHFGTIASTGLSWALLSQDTKRLFGNDFKYNSNFAYSYGFSAGYDFTNEFGVEINWIVNAFQGQKFTAIRQQKDRVKEINGEMDLIYTQIPVILKYKMAKLSRKAALPSVLNYYAGFQYSYLKSQNFFLNNVSVAYRQDISRHEVGFVFGTHYDLFLSRHVSMSLGMRGILSAEPRTFLGNEMDNPYNVFFGFTAGLNYLIPRK